MAPPTPPPVAVVVRGLGRFIGFGIGEMGTEFDFFTVMPLRMEMKSPLPFLSVSAIER